MCTFKKIEVMSQYLTDIDILYNTYLTTLSYAVMMSMVLSWNFDTESIKIKENVGRTN